MSIWLKCNVDSDGHVIPPPRLLSSIPLRRAPTTKDGIFKSIGFIMKELIAMAIEFFKDTWYRSKRVYCIICKSEHIVAAYMNCGADAKKYENTIRFCQSCLDKNHKYIKTWEETGYAGLGLSEYLNAMGCYDE